MAPFLGSNNGNALENAVDRLSTTVFPQATLGQLLATLLLVGVLTLVVGLPIARKRQHVRRLNSGSANAGILRWIRPPSRRRQRLNPVIANHAVLQEAT